MEGPSSAWGAGAVGHWARTFVRVQVSSHDQVDLVLEKHLLKLGPQVCCHRNMLVSPSAYGGRQGIDCVRVREHGYV